MSDLGKGKFKGSKPPLGPRCFVFSKGNLAVGFFIAETVQVFDQKVLDFQRKRRRDVCKNALARFYMQRLFKFLRKSIAVGNFKMAFIFTKIKLFSTKKYAGNFYSAVVLVNIFCVLFFLSGGEAPGI